MTALRLVTAGAVVAALAALATATIIVVNHDGTGQFEKIRDVVFSENGAVESGGGMFCDTDCNPALTNVTFAMNEATDTGGIYLIDSCDPTINNTIIAYSTGGAMNCQVNSNPTIVHCYSFQNDGDDLCGARADNVIGVDPRFCDVENDHVTLASTSPCLVDNNDWEELVGACGQGSSEPAVEPASWGRIKAFYR